MINFEHPGAIQVICGPMASGKSEELIRRITRYEIAGKSVIVFKPKADSRDFNSISSRAGCKLSDNVFLVGSSEEMEHKFIVQSGLFVGKEASSIELVAIDEAQFFDEHIIDVVKHISRYADVIVSGLEKDCMGNPFGPMPGLLAIADEVFKLKAICRECRKRYASYTYRKIKSNDIIVVGGDETYEARCRICWEA